MHLLALLIELVSIKVAGKQIKKAIDIPRPGSKGKQERQQSTPSAPAGESESGGRPVRAPVRPPSQQPSQQQQDAFSKGIAVLRSTTKVRR